MLQLVLGGVLIVAPVGAFAAGASPAWLLAILLGILVLGVRRDTAEARWED